MTFEAWKPPSATFELYRYDVEFAVPVGATCLIIDLEPVDIFAVDRPHSSILHAARRFVKIKLCTWQI